MAAQLIFFASIVIHGAAVVLALRLIWITGQRRVWLLLAAALVLIAIWRVAVTHFSGYDPEPDISLRSELIGLVVATFLLFGMAGIGPAFRSIQQSREAMKISYEEMERRIVERTSALENEIAERALLERALRATEARYRAVVEDQTEMICRFLPDGALTFVNSAFCRHFNKSPDELIGYIFTPLDFPALCAAHGPLTPESPVAVLDDWCTEGPDGKTRWEQWTIRAIFDDQGKFTVYQAVGQDITERKQHELALIQAHELLEQRVEERTAELRAANELLQNEIAERRRIEDALRQNQEALRTQREFLYHVIDTNPSLIFAKDREGRYTLVNRAMAEHHRMTIQELLGKRDADINPDPRQVEIYDAEDRQVFENRCPIFLFEEEDCDPETGETLWYQKIKAPILSSSGEVEYVLGVCTDITQRKRLEEALQQREEWLRTLINASPDVICFKDGEGRWLIANDANLKVFGLEGVDYVGKTDRELAAYSPVYRQAFLTCQETDEQAWANGAPISAEETIPFPDGTLRVFDVIKVPLFNPDGSRRGLVVVGRDITTRLETDQQALQLELEQSRVKILADFIRDASHEFGTALSTINTTLYLLRQITDPEKRLKQLDQLDKQIAHIQSLLTGLLTMSKLDSGGDFVFHPLDINHLIHDVRTRVSDQVAEANLTMTLNLTKDLPLVLADDTQLYRAVMNLVENAIQYTPAHGSITLRTGRQDDYLVIEVCDTGIGIGESDLPHIFDRFYRADRARTTRRAGLGLPIARKIVEMHGGDILVESTLGHGSTFRILLPISHS